MDVRGSFGIQLKIRAWRGDGGGRLATQRHLDDIEEMYFYRGDIPSIVVEYEGDLDLSALSRAFRLACSMYPVLRGRIVADGERLLLAADPTNDPIFETFEGGEDTMLEQTEKHPIDLSRNTSRLVVVQDKDRGFVFLQTSHALVDARAIRAIFERLWHLYSDIVDGETVEVASNHDLPPSPLEVLEDKWGDIDHLRQEVKYLKDRDVSALRYSTDHIDKYSSEKVMVDQRTGLMMVDEDRWWKFEFSQPETEALIHVARTTHVSVNGLLSGLILISQRSLAGPIGPVPMLLSTVVDMRDRLAPPVAATGSTNPLLFATATVIVDMNSSPFRVGQEIEMKTRAIIDSRHGLSCSNARGISAYHERHSFTSPMDRSLAFALFTNAGVEPDLPNPPRLLMRRSFFARTSPLPKAMTSLSRSRMKNATGRPHPLYTAWTARGRLTIEGVCPSNGFTQNNAERLRVTVGEEVRRLISGPHVSLR